MNKNSFLGRIVSSIFLVAVLLMTTVSNFSDRLETPVYSEQNIGSTLIAAANRSETTYPTDDSKIEGKLYGDNKSADSLNSVDDLISPTAQKQLLDPTQIPAKKQPIIDRSNPDNKLLEKAGQMFDDSGVLNNE